MKLVALLTEEKSVLRYLASVGESVRVLGAEAGG
jgi:hypothetical protein